jgi:hypothetical protein
MNKNLQFAAYAMATLLLMENAVAQSPASTRLEKAARMPATERVTPAPAVKAEAGTALPSNLFSMDDRAIIIVSGKQMAAGDVKRQIRAGLDRNATVQETFTVARLNQHSAMPQVMERNRNGNPARTADHAKVSTGPTPGSPGWTPKEPNSNDARLAGELACRDNEPPKIARMTAALTPGGNVTLIGSCFGSRTGAVEVIGQFTGDKLQPAFTAWNEKRIDLQIPANIRGASDHAVSVTVVTSDGARSTAAQGRFVAARERIQVPDRYWTPAAAISPIAIDPPGGRKAGESLFAAATRTGAESYVNDFRVSVSPECTLDVLELPTTRGHVHEVRGWQNGPPNESSVQIVWSPVCTTTTTDYLIATSSQSICSADIQLNAWAFCPAGRAP